MKTLLTSLVLLSLVCFAFGCQTAPTTETSRAQLVDEADAAINDFKVNDPSMDRFFRNSYAYAVFPSVGKGGAGVGGAYGQGVAYQGGRPVGYCDLSQATVGFQLGGQAYRQIIFFESQDAFETFKSGNFAFAAQTSAVAATYGASADADYDSQVAVFTMTRGGLMYEATIGGQKFSYQPM